MGAGWACGLGWVRALSGSGSGRGSWPGRGVGSMEGLLEDFVEYYMRGSARLRGKLEDREGS